MPITAGVWPWVSQTKVSTGLPSGRQEANHFSLHSQNLLQQATGHKSKMTVGSRVTNMDTDVLMNILTPRLNENHFWDFIQIKTYILLFKICTEKD